MLEEKIQDFLGQIEQQHLAEGLELLSEEQKIAFWEQLTKYPLDLLQKQRDVIFSPHKDFSIEDVTPIHEAYYSGERSFLILGKARIREKKLGCIVLAGGQASRLRAEFPKALYPVTLIRNKTLLQLLLEKVKAASIEAECDLCIAIMVSPFNRQEIQHYLEENHFFGLKKEQVTLFCQDVLPLLDEKGNWILEEPGKILEGPDGNGKALQLFMENGLGASWLQKGITDVNVIFIDNPLADPFDAELCDFRYAKDLDVAIKVIEREDPNEKVGVLASYQGKTKVIEYTELSSEQRTSRNEEGELLFTFANTGLFCFSLSFLEKLYMQKRPTMPWHIAKKKAHIYSDGRRSLQMIYKLESFLFDIFDFVRSAKLLIYPREDVFAPLKNETGEDSVESVQEKLLQHDQKVFEKLSGISVKDRVFELDPGFYYPTAEIQEKWWAKPLPQQDYIEP
ncbi:MAG: hypothetical protein HKM07_00305 [Chlamydiae bacterium]|nr:hypothetical protein [Chlamydiota bacterium]